MNSVYNLNIELEIESVLLQRLKRQRERIFAKLAPKGYPTSFDIGSSVKSSSTSTMGFTDALERIDKLDTYIAETEKNIERIKKDINKINRLVESLTGLEKKVRYMQLVEGKNLKEIASELDYNYGYIRNLASKM